MHLLYMSFSNEIFTTWLPSSILVQLFGAVANLILIYTLKKDHVTNNSIRMLITNIAVANFLLCAIIIPAATAGVYLHRYHKLPQKFCPISQSMYYVGIAGVFWGEVCLAMNRVVWQSVFLTNISP